MSLKQFKALLKLLKKFNYLNLQHLKIIKSDNYNYIELNILDSNCFDSGYCYKYVNCEYVLINEFC